MRIDPWFAELYRREFQTVFRAVWALCGDRAAAEDATQESFARALERWRTLRDRPWVAGWVTTTAMNAARRALRSRPGPNRVEPEGEPDPEAGMDLWQAVRRLPRRQQEAVVLYYAVDLPVGEVAELMRCEEGTVKAHLARARAALRGALEETKDDR